MIDLVKQALEDERCWTVYVHTSPSNKRYVGITSQKNPKNRWNYGHGYRTQPFYNAIKKYGWENFKHEIVASNLTKDEANAFEMTLIRELDTLIQNGKGYNTTEGGGGTKGINKDRSMYTGKNATNVNRVICLNNLRVFDCIKFAMKEYNTDNISKCCRNQQGYKSAGKDPITGEKLMWAYYDETKPDEYYIKMREEKKSKLKVFNNGNGSHRAKRVIDMLTGKIYRNSTHAQEETGESVRNKLRSKNNSRWMYLEDYEKLNQEREAI